MTTPLIPRTWIYVLPPSAYECTCDKCGGTLVTWSEWQCMMWCFTCQIDTEGISIFSGPIPLELCKMLLGDNCFDRVILATGAYERFVLKGDHVEWQHVYYIQPEFTTA